MRIPARIYQQFDADVAREVPAEAYGGWMQRDIDLASDHTALVVMHAWDSGGPNEFPGWHRAVEYLPRAEKILANVFPRVLASVRNSSMKVFHVVGGDRDYYSHLEGYRETLKLAGQAPIDPRVPADAAHRALRGLRAREVFPGAANRADTDAGLACLDFAPTARPVGAEPIAKDGFQLGAICRAHGVNHLIYVGFAINWCLLMSPGGMIDMSRQGCLCSTIDEAVTAVENRETARQELEKAQALWRIAVEFGFVFGLEDFLRVLEQNAR